MFGIAKTTQPTQGVKNVAKFTKTLHLYIFANFFLLTNCSNFTPSAKEIRINLVNDLAMRTVPVLHIIIILKGHILVSMQELEGEHIVDINSKLFSMATEYANQAVRLTCSVQWVHSLVCICTNFNVFWHSTADKCEWNA